MKRGRRFRCDGGMAAAVAVAGDLGILDGEAGDSDFRERKEREVALKRRGVVPDSAAGATVPCPAVSRREWAAGWAGSAVTWLLRNMGLQFAKFPKKKRKKFPRGR